MAGSLTVLKKEIRRQGDPVKAQFFRRFFRTGKGQYAEGDRFLGITVPVQRALAKKYRTVSVGDALQLLHSSYHEERLIALFLLVRHFQDGDAALQKQIYTAYLKNTAWVNNWDLVDSSAYHIVGPYLRNTDRRPLLRLAKSSLLWNRRIAIVATYDFIRRGDLAETFRIAAMLLDDQHDLMHKAVGWMLREAGKKEPGALRAFLKKYATRMPRTMLRYAIERFSRDERSRWLAKK